MQNDTLAQIIGEIGPLDGDIRAIYDMQDDGVGWAIRYEPVDIRIENRPDAGAVAISVLIGGPKGELAPDIFRALLAANALWRDNGGLRFALASTEDHIEISITLRHSEVTPQSLVSYARGMARHAMNWSALFTGNVTDDAAEGSAAAFDAEMIRL